MEESEVNEDYIDVGSMAATIAKMRQETPPVSPARLQNSVTGSCDDDQHGRKVLSDGATAKEESVYQLPKANPTPSPHGQQINRPLVPPKIVKRTKRGKPLTQHSQQPLSSLHDHKQEIGSNTPIHEASFDGTAGNELTESKDPNNAANVDRVRDKAQQEESIYQTVKMKPVPLPRLSNKPLDPLLPPKNIMRPRSNKSVSDCPQSSTLPSDDDKTTSDTPVEETVQSPADSGVMNESTQNHNPNKAADASDGGSCAQQGTTEPAESGKVQLPTSSGVITEPTQPKIPNKADELIDAEQTNAKGQFIQDEARKLRGSGYQMLKLNQPPSKSSYEQRLLPPRSPKSPLHPQSPVSPLDKDKVSSNTTPVDETVQSPTAVGSDVMNQSTQDNKSTKVADADPTNTRRTDQQQRSQGYQTLKANPPSSPTNDEKTLDPLIPPRNIMRPKSDKSALHPQSPTSPLDKDKIQDKLTSVIQDKTKILTPPRQMNPYILEFGSKRNAGSSSSTEKEPPVCDQQRQGSLLAQHKNKTPEPEEKELNEEEQSYILEEFVEIYQLPQLVTVTEGHYGTTEEFSMSEGMEIILFFKKKTQAVIAMAEHTGETYHIPLNCSLQFSPYQRNSKEHLTKTYHYKTVNHLLKRPEGLPKVVKVLKSHKSSPAINANELIFPKGLSSKGTHLKCTDIRKEEIQLKLTCDIGFSTNPSDTKMDLEDYVEHINNFPSSVIVFCDRETTRSIFEIHTGMEMVLQECKMLYSCICSTDVHGTMNYPLMELLTALPIEVKAISSPTVGLEPIYDTVKKVYETFNVSMVQSSMFLAQNDQHDYEVIRRSNNYLTVTKSVNFYSLEMPAVAFTTLPPRKKTQDSPVKSPPLPPRHDKPTASQLQTQLESKKQRPLSQQDSADGDTDSYIYTTSADQRRLYLSSFTVDHVLKLLDRLNLGQFKGVFQQNNVDGTAMLSFTKNKLEQLGMNDSISQQHLLDVISGHTIYKVK